MSKGTAILSILIAFVGGLAIGNLVGRSSTPGGDEVSAEADTGGGGEGGDDGLGAGNPNAAPADGIERYRVPVTSTQPSKGPRDALVTMVIFSEFQCPFCSRVEPTLTQLMNDYRGKLRMVWRNQPLPFHQNARPAAMAAMEAFAQGGDAKFWQYHDLMFANQQALERADLERYAGQVGLDMTRFRQALDTNAHAAKIDADMQVGNGLGANGTPTFFINGRQLMGAQPIDAFKTIIDEEIRNAERLRGTGIAADRVYAELTRNGRTSAAPPAAAPGAPGAAPGAPQPPRQMPDPNAVYRVPVGSSPVKGPADALVTVVIFSEYQCPFCSRVEPTLAQLATDYGRDIRFVFKDNPLPFHDNARPAAMAAREAFAQGGNAKFWQMHDLLFANQQALTRPDLERYATQVGLDMGRFRAALDGNTHDAAITADQQLAQSVGASGTPSFFINGRNLRGAQPLEAFKRLVDEELAKARQKVAAGTPRNRVYEETTRGGATSPVMIAAPAQPGAQPGAAPPGPPPEDPNRVYNIAVPAGAARKGARNARVVIQQFSDYECPFCSRVEPTIDQLMTEYGTRIQIVWRDFPLPFHQNATPAAEAAREAMAQGGQAKFWQMHGLLMQNQRALTRPDLERYAQQIGLDMGRFRAAMDGHTHQAAIQADMDAVRQSGAQIGTPSFFINGRLLQGAQPIDAFKTAIDRALAEPAR